MRLTLRLLVGLFVGVVLVVAAQQTHPVFAITYPAGWNLVSGPTGSTLKGATGLLYTLQPGDTEYEQVAADAPLTGGYGYWAYFPAGGELIRGAGSATYTASLEPGQWAMLGNPASWAGATFTSADTALTYSPADGYQGATTLAIGQGAWVLGSGAVTVTAPPAAPLSLTFLRQVPPGQITNIPTTYTPYTFQVGGANLLALNLAVPDELGPALQVADSNGTLLPRGNNGYGFGYLRDAGELVISLTQGIPFGPYTVTLTLPDGRSAQAKFIHMAAASVQ